jgi:putative endonuclease
LAKKTLTKKISPTRAKGDLAEDLACNFLKTKGYSIVKRNFSCKYGEIDIIANHNGDLVFVEVRSRNKPDAYHPLYTIDARKQKKLIAAAWEYLQTLPDANIACRFDVVTVIREPLRIEVIADAFGCDPDQFYL